MQNVRRIFLSLSLLCLSLTARADAEPVTAEQARLIAENWLESRGQTSAIQMSSAVREIIYYANEGYGDVGHYIAYLVPNGWLAIPADDRFETVIAFGSDALSQEEYMMSPLKALLGMSVHEEEVRTASLKKLAAVQEVPSKNDLRSKRWKRLLEPREGTRTSMGGMLRSAAINGIEPKFPRSLSTYKTKFSCL
jgi:hypothetical protein